MNKNAILAGCLVSVFYKRRRSACGSSTLGVEQGLTQESITRVVLDRQG